MVSAKRFNPVLVRAILDGTISAQEMSDVGVANVLSIRTDPENIHRGKGGLLVQERAEDGEGTRVFSYVMSTENPVGHSGDIIRTAGWDLSDFEKRKQPLLYNHNLSEANADLPLGRMGNVRKGRASGVRALLGDALIQRGVSPFNDLVLDQIEAGDLNGFSVGWRTIQAREFSLEEKKKHADKISPWAVVFERSSLVEGSITTVGMDPDAVKVRSMNARLDTGRRAGRYTPDAIEQFRSMVPELEAPRGRGFVAMKTPTLNTTETTEVVLADGTRAVGTFIPDEAPAPDSETPTVQDSTEGERALSAAESETALLRVLETESPGLAESVRNLIGETRDRAAVDVQRSEFTAMREENDDLRAMVVELQEQVSGLAEVTTGVRLIFGEETPDETGEAPEAVALADMTDQELLDLDAQLGEVEDGEGDANGGDPIGPDDETEG